MMPDFPFETEKFEIEKLNDDIKICVSKEHRFGTDAFLLADFADKKRNDIICDLGTGCGIIPMIFSKSNQPKRIYGVDIQEMAIEQFAKSLEISTLKNEVIPICADLIDLKLSDFSENKNAEFSLITCNPPYKIDKTGILSESKADKIARHETKCTIDDICKTAKRLLKFGGRLCFCQRPQRLCDVIFAMRNNGIEPKRLRFVSKNQDTQPWLFLIEGKKGAKPFLSVLPPLYMYDGEEYSSELQEIYNPA